MLPGVAASRMIRRREVHDQVLYGELGIHWLALRPVSEYDDAPLKRQEGYQAPSSLEGLTVRLWKPISSRYPCKRAVPTRTSIPWVSEMST
jgi:hypothetical protein